MIVALLLAAVAAGSGLLRGGSLDSLAATRFRWPWLLIVGLGSQIAIEIWSPGWLDEWGGLVVLLASYALVGGFLIANIRLPGVVLAAIGMALNIAVIAANGAMPVSERALDKAGYEGDLEKLGAKHEILDDDTVLPWLADVIPVPYLRAIVSVGDVVLALGLAQLVYRRTRGESAGKHLARGS